MRKFFFDVPEDRNPFISKSVFIKKITYLVLGSPERFLGQIKSRGVNDVKCCRRRLHNGNWKYCLVESKNLINTRMHREDDPEQ